MITGVTGYNLLVLGSRLGRLAGCEQVEPPRQQLSVVQSTSAPPWEPVEMLVVC